MSATTQAAPDMKSNPLPSSQSASTLAGVEPSKHKKTLRFWIIFGSLMAVAVLTAIDLTIISTTLPTIVRDLPPSSVSPSWVTSAFLLTTTAFQPFMGGLADVVGRRNALVVAVLLFLLGSIIAAVGQSMLVLVVGRAVQGVGGGGIQAIVEIVISDLTTLKERGLYVGLISVVFAVASFIAPVLGGVFSASNWRWIFWINLPIGAVALALIIPCMKLNTPSMPLARKIHRMDILANTALLAGMIGVLYAITEGGIAYPWSSWRIIVALAGGAAGLVLFFALEFVPNRLAQDPILPLRLFSNRTAASCFALTFLHGLVTYGEIYLLPVYFQSIKGASPLQSAIDLFPATAPGPVAAILAGIAMAWSGRYKWQTTAWWVVLAVGCGVLTLLGLDTPTWQWALFQVIAGLAVGALFTLLLPPIQSSLPIEELAHATAACAFCRSFGSVWGIALGTNVFIGTVNGRLQAIPGLEAIGLRGSTALGFATELHRLPAPLQAPVREAFQHALHRSFIAFVPVATVGVVVSLFVRELPLPDFNRSHHGIQDKPRSEEEAIPRHGTWTPSDGTLRGSPPSSSGMFAANDRKDSETTEEKTPDGSVDEKTP